LAQVAMMMLEDGTQGLAAVAQQVPYVDID